MTKVNCATKMNMPYVKAHVDLTFFDTAPWKFVNSCVVDAPASEVFALFEDGKAWPLWFPRMTNVSWTSPKPYGVGTTRDVSLGDYSLAEYFIRWDGESEVKRFSFCLEGQVILHVQVFVCAHFACLESKHVGSSS